MNHVSVSPTAGNGPTQRQTRPGWESSSETQGQIVEARGKSKQAKENGDEEKHSRARRAHGDTFLPDQFQTVGVILNSDWCQKFFVFFCPIRGQQAAKSFRVFLHGNHLITILAWFGEC